MENLLFIPMYNCEKQIVRVLKSLTPNKTKCFSEILIIDNRSTDESVAVAASEIKKMSGVKVTLVRNNKNINLGGSHKVAFNYCKEKNFDSCTVLHGDDQGCIDDLLTYMENGRADQFDCFLGSRFLKDSKLVGYSKIRTLGNLFFNRFTSLVTGKTVLDMGSGLNYYSSRYLEGDFYLHYPNDLTFNTWLLLHAIYTNAKIDFFPLTWKEEDQVSNAKIFKQACKNLNIILNATRKKDLVVNRREVKDQAIVNDFVVIQSH